MKCWSWSTGYLHKAERWPMLWCICWIERQVIINLQSFLSLKSVLLWEACLFFAPITTCSGSLIYPSLWLKITSYSQGEAIKVFWPCLSGWCCKAILRYCFLICWQIGWYFDEKLTHRPRLNNPSNQSQWSQMFLKNLSLKFMSKIIKNVALVDLFPSFQASTEEVSLTSKSLYKSSPSRVGLQGCLLKHGQIATLVVLKTTAFQQRTQLQSASSSAILFLFVPVRQVQCFGWFWVQILRHTEIAKGCKRHCWLMPWSPVVILSIPQQTNKP